MVFVPPEPRSAHQLPHTLTNTLLHAIMHIAILKMHTFSHTYVEPAGAYLGAFPPPWFSFASYAYLGFHVGACFGFDSLWTIGFNFIGKKSWGPKPQSRSAGAYPGTYLGAYPCACLAIYVYIGPTWYKPRRIPWRIPPLYARAVHSHTPCVCP